MRILWLFPPSEGFPNISQYRFFKRMPIRATIIYPYLAASGVTQLHEAGHDVAFIDAPTEDLTWEDVLLRIEMNKPELIIMEARAPIMDELAAGIAKIKRDYWDRKENSRPLFAVYGDHVSWQPQIGLEAGADFVIQGGDYDWGALTLCQELCRSGIQRPRTDPEMPGIYPIWNPGLLKDLNKMAWVDRELVHFSPYFESWKERPFFFWIMSSRGCGFGCSMCAWAGTLWDDKIRFRDPVDVASEMYYLFNEYGPCEILDDADCFSPFIAQRTAARLEDLGITEKEIRWGMQTHPNLITDLAVMKRLKAVGLSLVKLGCESGNQETLDRIHKGLKIEQTEKAIKILQEADISVHANMVVGWPWENKEKAYHSIEWIKKLRPNQAQFSLIIPYPNTELYDMAKSNGWLSADPLSCSPQDFSKPMLLGEMSSEEVVQLYQDAWRMFYLDPKFIARKLLKIHDKGSIMQLINGYKSVVKGHMKAVGA